MTVSFDSVLVFSCSPFGEALSGRVSAVFPLSSIRLLKNGSASVIESAFSESRSGKRVLLVFVCALGICVRKIAPFLESKFSDPAVICVDDAGSFVVPVLSGHVGGANEAARAVAASLGAVPVVTTSTDLHGAWALDVWAEKKGFPLGPLSSSLSSPCSSGRLSEIVRFANSSSLSSRKILSVGVGCRRGCESEKLIGFVESFFESESIPFQMIGRISSIDLKRDEKAVADLARAASSELSFFSKEELLGIGDWIPLDASLSFSSSPFVLETVGVDCVCERCAVAASEKKFLIARKRAFDGMTVAVAL